MDQIERRHGYTDEMMYEHCRILKTLIDKKKEIKTGRHPNIQIKEVYKHYTEPEIRERINNSYNYYERIMKSGIKFRDYQIDIIDRGASIINQSGFLYLSMEVRTGKTLTSLGIANKIGAKQVLFITKKKAVTSIADDYKALDPNYEIVIINYESVHTVMNDSIWDLIILDEAHSIGAFPKPNQRALLVQQIIRKCKPKVILLSGTPTPESFSQMYHQVFSIPGNPFREFANFYRFCDVYVDVKQKKINGLLMNDYTRGKDTIIEKMRPYTISYTQEQAGFITEVTEEVLYVDMKEITYKMIKRLKADLVIEGKEEVILADTPTKLMGKIHQLSSGTIKFESGNSMVIDMSKAEFIKDHFDGCKIGIFYKFKEELNALKAVYGDDLTTDLGVFKDTDKNIALQIVSGREGISLKEADYLVYYNIDFSATSYWQSKDRMTTMDRANNNVYWVFSRGGIEDDIYKAVTKKKDYTVSHFKKTL